MFRKLRIVISSIFFIFLTLSLLGVIQVSFFSDLQLLPAIIAINVGVVAFWIILTLLLGRSYCSIVCPLGFWQDIVDRFSRLFYKNKKYYYGRYFIIVRYLFLIIGILAYLLSCSLVISLLDPYSAYAQVVHQIIRPLWIPVHNFIATFNEQTGWWMQYQDFLVHSCAALLIAIGILFVVSVCAWFGGRLFCNIFCPVGTILGFISRWSLLEIKIDKSHCSTCEKCVVNCKAACFSEANVESSRCVMCFNCMDQCPHGAISLGLRWSRFLRSNNKKNNPNKSYEVDIATKSSNLKDEGRRQFLLSSFTLLASASVAKAQIAYETTQGERWEKKIRTFMPDGRVAAERFWAIMPPATISRERFHQHCTNCHLCIVHCPEKILKPAVDEYGLQGFMQPTVSFENGWCRPDCKVCSEMCPTDAIRPLSIEEKRVEKLGWANFNSRTCVTQTDDVDCDACQRHCPNRAIIMVEKNGHKVPRINVSKCTGCGACEHYCPASPKAIYVEGLLY